MSDKAKGNTGALDDDDPTAKTQGDVRDERGGAGTLKPDERLPKEMEGQEVDEPDPTVEERIHGA